MYFGGSRRWVPLITGVDLRASTLSVMLVIRINYFKTFIKLQRLLIVLNYSFQCLKYFNVFQIIQLLAKIRRTKMYQPRNDTQVQLKIKPWINFQAMKLKLNQSKIKQGSKDRLFLVLGYIQIQVTQRYLMNDAVFCFALNNNSTISTLAEHSVDKLPPEVFTKFSVLTFNDVNHMYRILLFVVRC